jgi:spore maturation protein CgeB
MRVVIFTHSLISDWNHGNAHFLRGVAAELEDRGHEVRILEPANGWSLQNLLNDYGASAVEDFQRAFPNLRSEFYTLDALDLERTLAGADLVLVHEWNEPQLVARVGEYRAAHDHCLVLFHDTHHRSVTDPGAMGGYDLRHYDGVLAYGGAIRNIYLQSGWARQAWTWHEAADVRVFHPRPAPATRGDLVWIGNWGDGEREAELQEFLIEPVKSLRLRARVYGVRYPAHALAMLESAGVEYGGWLPNYRVPEVFAQFRVTVHVPRRPYAERLPGIPTIRPFEALSCGIPLISAPWNDSEGLFEAGKDYLMARDGAEMERLLRRVLRDARVGARLREHGLETIRERHTCAHRVDELMGIYDAIAPQSRGTLEDAPTMLAEAG